VLIDSAGKAVMISGLSEWEEILWAAGVSGCSMLRDL
jgi:hypothetical protein